MTSREDVVRSYIDRVVNRRDISAIDDHVSPAYRGTGADWPSDRDALRQFYENQYVERPDWRIDVMDAMELGNSVVARALAGGTSSGERRRLAWLARYQFEGDRIARIDLLEWQPLDGAGSEPPWASPRSG